MLTIRFYPDFEKEGISLTDANSRRCCRGIVVRVAIDDDRNGRGGGAQPDSDSHHGSREEEVRSSQELNMPGSATQVVFALLHPSLLKTLIIFFFPVHFHPHPLIILYNAAAVSAAMVALRAAMELMAVLVCWCRRRAVLATNGRHCQNN